MFAVSTAMIDPGAPDGAVFLKEGESLYVAPGKMQAAKNVRIVTEYTADIFESIKRFFVGGPEYFNNRFEARTGGGWVLLEEKTPGQVEQMEILSGEELKIRRDRWVASTPNVNLRTTYEGVPGLIQGTGIAMITACCKADAQRGKIFFCSGDGILKKIQLTQQGGPVTVDNDSIVAYTGSLDCSFRMGGSGLQSLFFGKEGIVCDFYGNGTIYISSVPQDRYQADQKSCQDEGISDRRQRMSSGF